MKKEEKRGKDWVNKLTLAAPGSAGDLLVLKVGSPLRIESLARRLLTVCGRDGGEPLLETTLVTGEKLHEDLAGDLRSEPTASPWIDRLVSSESDPAALAEGVDALRAACGRGDGETVAALLRRLAED